MDQTDRFDEEAISLMPDRRFPSLLFRGDGSQFADVSKEWETAGMKGYYNGASMRISTTMETLTWS